MHHVIERLSQEVKLPHPGFHLIHQEAPNELTFTGRHTTVLPVPSSQIM